MENNRQFEIEGRSLPSVNERRLHKTNARQWLFVLLLLMIIGGIVVWLMLQAKNLWHKDLENAATADNPEKLSSKVFNTTPPPVRVDRQQAMPSLPGLPAPPPPTNTALKNYNTPQPTAVEAPVVAEKRTLNRMMLTDSKSSSPDTNANTTRSASAAKVAEPKPAATGLSSLLQSTTTARAYANQLGNRNFILAKGNAIDCVLNTRLDSSVPGMTSCIVTRNVYSDNGKVLLVERGSLVTGEYTTVLGRGSSRIFVLWDRIKTPQGVVIQIDSPAADELGASGLPGYVNNHWGARIGAAVLLSMIDDVLEYERNKQESENGIVVFGSDSASSKTGQRMAEKVLDSTINIPSTLHKNQGERVSVYVARDLDFNSVYELQAK